MLKVLIAEDDLMIADAAEAALIGNGYEVCGIARTVAEAVELGRIHKPDLAVIDMRLADGGLGNEIAAQLSSLGRLGVLYATGNVSLVALTAAHGDACLVKPYSSAALVRGLDIVSDIVATGETSQAFPHGFQLLPLATTGNGKYCRAPMRVPGLKAIRHRTISEAPTQDWMRALMAPRSQSRGAWSVAYSFD